MARPRQDSPEPSARERMIAAFWKMMAQMPFDGITIGGISREANVSQNTLYYHFDGILGIAREAVEAELSEDMARKMLDSSEDNGLALLSSSDPRDFLRLSRIGLIASSGSARLTGMLIDMLKEAWCHLANKEPESLTEEETMDLDFIYGGLVSVLSNPAVRENARSLAGFLQRPLGRGVTAAMARLFPEPSLNNASRACGFYERS